MWARGGSETALSESTLLAVIRVFPNSGLLMEMQGWDFSTIVLCCLQLSNEHTFVYMLTALINWAYISIVSALQPGDVSPPRWIQHVILFLIRWLFVFFKDKNKSSKIRGDITWELRLWETADCSDTMCVCVCVLPCFYAKKGSFENMGVFLKGT